MSSQARPGKTAPRLLHDLLIYDPQCLVKNYNILTNPPPLHEPSLSQNSLLAREVCRHEYITNGQHGILPPQDSRAKVGDRYISRAICKRCRIHLKVETDYQHAGLNVCPNSERPLHHFLFEPSSGTDTSPLVYHFRCSSPDCSASVQISYTQAVIDPSDLALLTSLDLLKKRYETVVTEEAKRSGFNQASPVDVLWRLRRYVHDALESPNPGRRIPAHNKKFQEAFGKDCNGLLQRIGFKYGKDANEEFWVLPPPPAHTSDTELNEERMVLESWDVESQTLIERFCARDGDTNPVSNYTWLSARGDLERILSAQGYARSSKLRIRSDSLQDGAQDHPFYASLGALRDFADELIIFAHDRQCNCDPSNVGYYFDCLQDLAKGRESEELMIKASTLESQGVVGRKDTLEAYKQLDISSTTSVSDDFIIGRYRSRMEDTGPAMQPHLKAILKTLGNARQSQKLLDAASDVIKTYDQALAWLGAEHGYADESILTLHTAKTADNPETAEPARRAVSIIAEARNSDSLRSWLTTGELKETAMGIDDACRHLNITLDALDESTMNVVFDSARLDNPGHKTDLAIDAVTKAYKRPKDVPAHLPSTWPVGLTSHGNTCYLNSLLQYYFTIKPLRDIILHFDEYKFDLETHKGKEERVGARRVKPFEIDAYQKFVNDLKHLFDSMIKDPSSAVKPEADLVCRAFLKASETDAGNASSAVSEIGAENVPNENGNSINDVQMTTDSQFSSTAALTEAFQPTPGLSDAAGDNITDKSRPNSIASSTTLPVVEKDHIPDAMTMSTTLPPSPPASRPSSPNELKPEPLHAPPLPPRNLTTPEIQKSNLEKAEEAARQQQDVTEVMDEILFRLRCAIRPMGMDKREEQLDQFRDIFYMRIAEMTYAAGEKAAAVTEDVSNILLNIPSEPTDIYSALDDIFDLQTIDRAGKQVLQYKAVQTLPPILQINIPRNTYNRTTGRGVKVDHRVHLDDALYMDRYLDDQGSDLFKKRQECWDWRKRLRAMQAEKEILSKTATLGMDGPAAIEAASEYLQGLKSIADDLVSVDNSPVELEESLFQTLTNEAEFLRHRLSAIDSRIADLKSRRAAQFDGLEKQKYRLYAVFFHRGGYGHGHYWTYIHDFQNSIWRVYNDEKVDEFTKLDDIYNAESWQQGTPTYAVYVRNDVKDDYVQAVCRDPVIPPTVESVNEVMQDEPSREAAPAPVPEWDQSASYGPPNVNW